MSVLIFVLVVAVLTAAFAVLARRRMLADRRRREFATAMAAIGHAAKRGAEAMQQFTAAFVAVKAAADFKAAMTRIQTQAARSASDMQAMSEDVLALAPLPVEPKENEQ